MNLWEPDFPHIDMEGKIRVLMEDPMFGNRRVSARSRGLALSVSCLVVALTSGCGPWPMYQGNAQRTGRSGADTSSTNGSVIWTSKVGDLGGKPVIGLGSDNKPVIYTGTSYWHARDFNFYALNMDGSLRWKFLTGSTNPSPAAVGLDKVIYFGSDDSYLYALNPDGTERWAYALPPCYLSPPPVPAIGNAPQNRGILAYDIYMKDSCGTVTVLTQNGTLEWMFNGFTDRSGSSLTPIALAPDGSVVGDYLFFGNDYQSGIYALTASGSLKWVYSAGFQWIHGLAIGADGTAYFHANPQFSATSNLYAVNPNGTLKWRSADLPISDGQFGSPGLAIGADGTIYLAEGGQGLWAIDPNNGNVKWSVLQALAFSTPVIGGDGTIFAGGSNPGGSFYAFHPDGSLRWILNSPCGISGSTPVIGSDATIYADGDDGNGSGQLCAIH
jgi:outer membrane protein assembly factor BamB